MLLVICRTKLTEAGEGLVQLVMDVSGYAFLLRLQHGAAYPA